MRMTRWGACLLGLLAGWPALAEPRLEAASGTGSPSAIQVVDDRGEALLLPGPLKRPATLATFAADTLMALGVAPVAVTRFGDQERPLWLGAEMAQAIALGQRGQPNLELLSRVQPDAILALRRYSEDKADVLNQLAPYVALDEISLDDSLRATTLLGTLVGKPGQARDFNAAFLARLEQLQQVLTPNETRRFALLVTGADVPFIYYDHFLPVELMRRLGLQNVAENSPAAKLPLGYRLPLERLLELDPDILVLLPSAQSGSFTHNPIWPHLKAVREHQVWLAGPHWKEGGGVRGRALMLEQIAHLMAPARFPKPDAAPELILERQ